MIVTKITVDGDEYNDYQRAKVSKSTDQNNASSNFEVMYDSPFGRHATDFRVGQEIILYADEDTAPPPIMHQRDVDFVRIAALAPSWTLLSRRIRMFASLQEMPVKRDFRPALKR